MKIFSHKNLALLIAIVIGTAVSSAKAVTYEYSAGHADIEIEYGHGGNLEFHFHAHSSTVLNGQTGLGGDYNPDDIVIVVPDIAAQPRWQGPSYDPIGNEQGDITWVLPETAAAGLPYLGIATAGFDGSNFDHGKINLTLTAVDGPGHFSLWQEDIHGPNFLLSSYLGLNNMHLHLGDHDHDHHHGHSHAHFNWGFTAPGNYSLTFTAWGLHQSHGEISEEATFTFEVIPEPTSIALVAIGSLMLIRKRR